MSEGQEDEIAESNLEVRDEGGCCALLVVLFLLGFFFVADHISLTVRLGSSEVAPVASR